MLASDWSKPPSCVLTHISIWHQGIVDPQGLNEKKHLLLSDGSLRGGRKREGGGGGGGSWQVDVQVCGLSTGQQ